MQEVNEDEQAKYPIQLPRIHKSTIESNRLATKVHVETIGKLKNMAHRCESWSRIQPLVGGLISFIEMNYNHHLRKLVNPSNIGSNQYFMHRVLQDTRALFNSKQHLLSIAEARPIKNQYHLLTAHRYCCCCPWFEDSSPWEGFLSDIWMPVN